MSLPADQPVVIYDGACGICSSQVERLRRLTGEKLRFESFRDPGVIERYPELKPEDCEAALQLVVPQPDGTRRIYSGAEGIVRAASKNRWLKVLLLPYYFPPIKLAAEAAYRWVAKNRFRLSKICGKEGCAVHNGVDSRPSTIDSPDSDRKEPGKFKPLPMADLKDHDRQISEAIIESKKDPKSG